MAVSTALLAAAAVLALGPSLVLSYNGTFVGMIEEDEIPARVVSAAETTRVNIGSGFRETITSTNFPFLYPRRSTQDFTFTVERCVQMVISCGFFHVPRPDIFRISMTNEANGVNIVGSYRSGNRPTRALFRQGSVTSFDLDVQISLIADNGGGRGFSCGVFGLTSFFGSPTVDPACNGSPPAPTTAPPAPTTAPPPPVPSPAPPAPTTAPPPPNTLQCGVGTTNNQRIIGGGTAPAGKYPWMVPLFAGNSFICGGSLIAPNLVLTAAHCVPATGTGGIRIGAGCTTLNSCRTVAVVNAIAIHPAYNPGNAFITAGNDVAVMRLATNVPIGLAGAQSINTVCLPGPGDSLPVGTLTDTAGWGRTGTLPTSPISTVLKEATMRVDGDNQCGSRNFALVMCLEQVSGRTCNGDSGSFLGIQRNGQYYAQGVTSYGFGTNAVRCQENVAGTAEAGFSDVAANINVIRQLASNLGVNV